MVIAFLDPNGDLTPLQWLATPGPAHFSGIDDAIRQPTVPDVADNIRETVIGEVDMISLSDSPADYNTNNSQTLWVYGLGQTRGATCELRKADETVLATVTIPAAGAAAWRSAVSVAALTKAEVDGLKIRFAAT